MDARTQIEQYLEERYALARNGVKLHADMLLMEQKIIDSIGMLELVSFLEETFGVEVPDEDISPDHFGTITKLVSYVDRRCSISVID